MQRDPEVKIYKSENNGAFAISTTCSTPEEFLRVAAGVIAALDQLNGDADFTLDALLPQVCDIWAKLRGYKADGVYEQRVLITGEPNPEAHMNWLNRPHLEPDLVQA